MAEKKINYIARDFSSIKDELLKFSQKYYPEMSDTYNDSSVGAWIIDLVSAVGDDLSYHTDRMYQENFINSANLRSSVLNNARMNGVKIPGPKASMCEIEVSCIIPSSNKEDMAEPNWSYAPYIKRGGVVSNGSSFFELIDDVDFREQFNQDGFSNRKYSPIRDKNGKITSYKVAKSVLATSGRSLVYKRVLTELEVKPFMEIILPEKNIMNVESIIFKEGTDFTITPDIYEYYIDAETYRISQDAGYTYRYFEVDSLVDQYRLGAEANLTDDKVIKDMFYPEVFDDYTFENEAVSGITTTKRYYKAQWKPLRNKFITEITDNGYTKIIFGAASTYEEVPSGTTLHTKDIMSKIINNDMLGELPRAGWTMYCLYRTGGGTETNVAQNSITNIVNFTTIFKDTDIQMSNDANVVATKRDVLNSLAVTNLSTAVAGKDHLSTEEVKFLTKYNVNAQNRCVTLKDYKVRLGMMPPKYGAPFRSSVIEDNNKILISFLGLNSQGKLDSALPQTLVDNIIEYMSYYKNLTDYIEMRSGKIYHLGFEIDVFIDKNYTTADVINRIIQTVKNYFDVNKRDMGEDIFIGDLQKEINLLDGVISLIDLRVFNLYGLNNYGDECQLPEATNYNESCVSTSSRFLNANGANCKQIGLDKTDGVLYADFDSMFEIRTPENDIAIRVKTR